MSVIRDGLIARARALQVTPLGEAASWEPYKLVVVKKDVVSTGGQAFVEGHLAVAAPDRLELAGEPHHLVFSSRRASHVAVPDQHLGFLDPPNVVRPNPRDVERLKAT